jgi:hypothetical protein
MQDWAVCVNRLRLGRYIDYDLDQAGSLATLGVQLRRRIGGVIDIVPPIGTTWRYRSCRVDVSLRAIDKPGVWLCTLGAKADIMDFDIGGTRVAIFM